MNGKTLVHKENGTVVKVIVVGTDGRAGIEDANGKRSSLSIATLKRYYTEQPAGAAQPAEKPAKKVTTKVVKKEVEKVPAKKQVEKTPAPKAEKPAKVKEPKTHLGNDYVEKVAKEFAKLEIRKKVFYTGLYKEGKIICLMFPRRKVLKAWFNQKLLAEKCGGNKFNVKGYFTIVPDTANMPYDRQIAIENEKMLGEFFTFVEQCAK